MPSTVADSLIIDPETIDEDYIHVVAGIIWQRVKRQQFLIAQRQKGKHLEHYWEFPGGKVEAGETPWQALQRELEEEIGIVPTRGEPFMKVYYRYPERNVLLDTWVVDEYRGEAVPREEQRLQWIEISEAGRFRLPPADVPVIEAIRNSVTAGTRYLP